MSEQEQQDQEVEKQTDSELYSDIVRSTNAILHHNQEINKLKGIRDRAKSELESRAKREEREMDFETALVRKIDGRQSKQFDDAYIIENCPAEAQLYCIKITRSVDTKGMNALLKAGKLPEEFVNRAVKIVQSADRYEFEFKKK